jgi:uncharacterized protein
MTETNTLTATDLDDAAIADYLRRHPDFLAHHADVLAALHVPHRPGGGVVSLIERQVEVLRAHNEALEERLTDLLRTARENERVGARLLGLGRGLLEADSLDAVLALVRDALLNEFSADFVWIRLIDEPAGERAARTPERFLRADAPELAPFVTCLEQGQPVCGGFDHERITALCASDDAELGSAAVVPLTAGRPIGIVVLASRDPRHFHAGMGTLFLAQLGELVTTGVARHLGGD